MNPESKKPLFFDIHSHLNFSDYDEDREDIINQMAQEGVWTITVGTNLKTSEEAVDLADKHEHIFATIGIHPTDDKEAFDEKAFEKLVSHPKVVGIGETGLDYYRIGNDEYEIKESQKELFIKQIKFANKYGKPLMIHGRPSAGTQDAYKDIYDILTDNLQLTTNNYPGNLHFFVGDKKTTANFLDLGFTLSFDGPITFTREYDEIIRFVPLNRIMVETDAPFAAPLPYRGKRNSTIYVTEIVKAIAEIRGEEYEKVRETMVDNAFKYWNI